MVEEGSPYLRIAGDIERRISSGDLRPGDRVPSTREITKQWGVAIATATKALAELRSRGLVLAVAGVGTVVVDVARPSAKPSAGIGTAASTVTASTVAASMATASNGKPRPGSVHLDSRRIIRAAIGIADAEGFAAVSMRRIAVELNVPTMSLYRWISSRDELLDGMLDELLGEVDWPSPPPPGWRAQLEFVARAQWAGYCAHPWLGRIVSLGRPQLAPKAMQHTEWVLRAIRESGPAGKRLDSNTSLYLVLTLFGHVKAAALTLDAERQAEQDTGIDIEEWIAVNDAKFAPVIQSGDYPYLAMLDDNADVDFSFDALFEFGLQSLLNGFERLLGTHDERPH